jgi:MFS superfamily sulfate permease-like transporter
MALFPPAQWLPRYQARWLGADLVSQSAVNDKAGAKTPLELLFASATLSLCLVFLTGLVQSLPKAVLAAIVLVAVKGLPQ